MTIKPKHTLNNKRILATRQFTDRDEFVNVFRKSMVGKRKDELSVITYYGVGGVGKTSLRKKMNRIMSEEYKKYMYGVIDFDVASYRQPETALNVLRKKFTKEYNVQFPLFDLAYAIYWKKVNPNIPLTEENFPLLEQGGIVADIFSVISDIPIAGIAPKILNLTLKGKETIKKYIHSVKNELRNLEYLEPNEIIQRLPLYWASDLRNFIDTKNVETVIFLDTYEALWDGKKKDGNFFLQDEWVRELILQLPEVHWIIFGREKLKWDKVDSEWDNYISQHLIGKLSEEDCKSFLESCGIYDRNIQQVIIESSMGLPYYLDISVDTYEKILNKYNRQPVPNDFGRTNVELFERFMKYLDQNEVETLKVLSTVRFWNKDIFQQLIERFKTGYPLTALNKLIEYSFIRQQNEQELIWDMHALMRKSLQEFQSEELRYDTHLFMFQYYNNRLIDMQKANQSNELLEAFYHASNCLSEEEFSNWFEKISQEYKENGVQNLLIPLYEQIIEHLSDNYLAVNHIISLIYIYNFRWNFSRVEELINKVFQIVESQEDTEWFIYASMLRYKAWMISKQGGELLKAENLIKDAISILETKAEGDIDDERALCYNNLGLNYKVQNKYNEAELAFEKAIAITSGTEAKPNYRIGKIYNNLGSSYYRKGDINSALSVFKKALKLNETATGQTGGSYLISLNYIARCYHEYEEYELAKKSYLQVLEKRKEIYGPSNSITSGSYYDLARIYHDIGDYALSKEYFEQAISIRESYLGKIHPGVGEIIVDYAKLLNDLGDVQETPIQLEIAKQITLSVSGMSEQKIRSLINLLKKHNRNEDVLELEHILEN